jgi:hypothetical protein
MSKVSELFWRSVRRQDPIVPYGQGAKAEEQGPLELVSGVNLGSIAAVGGERQSLGEPLDQRIDERAMGLVRQAEPNPKRR